MDTSPYLYLYPIYPERDKLLAQQLEDKDKQEEQDRRKKREEEEKHQRQIIMAKTQGKMEADAELGKTMLKSI